MYALVGRQFRRDFCLLLSKFGLCKQKAQQYRFGYSFPTQTIPLKKLHQSSRMSSNHNLKENLDNFETTQEHDVEQKTNGKSPAVESDIKDNEV